ncbi:MAG: prepilin-type N-terminal cleavage/methylation domain-containing protein [Bacilli bacterium]|nr:prepilin-type N-terminal cleavage/methylation domain-containing protein [Bacilli bacterium]MDD4718843.1 prepilin-type N-terminal cleavage/methylation domain-containing protein [Bacilli bacterium]
MNKKGFTLIELLAAIVILVIIFVITVPAIGNVINKSRYGVFGSSKKGIERAAELYYASNSKDIVWENDIGYVEVEKTADEKYEYNAYVDCLTDASTFNSHYVSYGGKYIDEFYDLQETSDGGFIAVGRSNSEVITKYGTENFGKYDAIIVKFKSDGEVEWGRNFGGSNNELFESVIETNDGYIAVGQTTSNDFDLEGLYKGGDNDDLIVKYDFNGNVIAKKSYGASGTNGAEIFRKIIKSGNEYVLSGSVNIYNKDGDLEGAVVPGSRSAGIILKLDNDLNTVWRSLFSGTYYEAFYSVYRTSDNSYIIVGSSSFNNYDMEGIGWEGARSNEAIILKFDSMGNLELKTSFRGSANETFRNVVETDDGYIVVGHSISSDLDMTGLRKNDNGLTDAIIVKYDKNLEDILWKKSFGGSNSEEYLDVVQKNENEVVVIGGSKSEDMDMQDIALSTGGYYTSIINIHNINNGNLISSNSFGGDNSDKFNSIIKTRNNQYVAAGGTFSNNKNLQNFNKGHNDAILVSYDNNLNLKKSFQEPVVIIDKLKTIQPNYGSELDLKYDNIYTSNDPTKDLLGWCSNFIPYTEGNTSNYYYGSCLEPFNPDAKKLLTELEVTSGLNMYQGEYEYKLTSSPDDNRNWLLLHFNNSSSTSSLELSNFKLKFLDGYIGHITDAINKGYIEPMAIVYSSAYTTRPAALYPTVIDIINDNGKTGIGSYPTLIIHIKPKKSELTSLFVTSSRDSSGGGGLRIYELRNFDMSTTPTT